MITLESHLVTTFLDEDVAFVKRLADRASVAIKNASLYADIQAAHSARAQFISLVTHELRLPLTSIKGYADLLTKGLAGPMTNQQKELMAVIQRNTLRMNSLISDLSDINRLESGRMKFEKSTFDILPLVNDANADLKVSIDQKGQALALQLPAEPVLVLADRGRVGQIITNLLSNAHKYTPSGGEITIEVTTDGSFARLEVRDTGFGISEEDQEKLFNQFFRSENPAVREQTGWGLGLSVVKMMVENQGGEVFFSSKLGEGSTFGFTLPVGNSSQLVG
jgi:signal transduction histidine kinase